MRVIITDTIDRDHWDDFVERHPLGTIYHHSLWQDVIRKTYGYKPLYYQVVDKSSNLQAAISSALVTSRFTGNRIVSFPFSDTCDPLVSDYDQLTGLLDAMESSRLDFNAQYVEIRFTNRSNASLETLSTPEYHTYRLDLGRQPQELLRSFHKNCIQRAIKKANREQFDLVTGETLYDLKEFYRLHVMTRKKHGVPVQPFAFFKRLWNTLAPRDMVSLQLVRHKGVFVAGIVLLWLKKTAYYKFGASDAAFHHLRPNQWLMWKAINLAQNQGCERFDFGRATSVEKGLATYKSRWGTKTTPLNYFQLPINRKYTLLSESTQQHVALKKLIRWLPKICIRISGEVLYRHLA